MSDALSPEDQLFLKKYGRLPPKKKPAKNPIARLHGGERKYFDSADHAMQAAGVNQENGNVIAKPNNIPRSRSRPSGMGAENAENGEKAHEQVAEQTAEKENEENKTETE